MADPLQDRRERAERIRARLEALERPLPLSPERDQAVLAERARALARPPDVADPRTVRVVRLRLGARAFAIEAGFVHAIVRAPRVTPVPAPPPLVGLLSWQGEVLPVVSFAALLGAGGAEAGGDGGPVMIVGHHAPELALRASEVDEVAELSAASIRPAPVEPGAARPLLEGALEDGALYLSGQALLEDPRLFF